MLVHPDKNADIVDRASVAFAGKYNFIYNKVFLYEYNLRNIIFHMIIDIFIFESD